LTRHAEDFVKELSPDCEKIDRILDANGQKGLGQELYNRYVKQSWGPLYTHSDGYRLSIEASNEDSDDTDEANDDDGSKDENWEPDDDGTEEDRSEASNEEDGDESEDGSGDEDENSE